MTRGPKDRFKKLYQKHLEPFETFRSLKASRQVKVAILPVEVQTNIYIFNIENVEIKITDINLILLILI